MPPCEHCKHYMECDHPWKCNEDDCDDYEFNRFTFHEGCDV